ncbi:ATP-binding cassette domain-containing protein [Helicobacter sp. MIT 21-1697]|uniref:ATP-binding cassette domain-containing protein n=1 Tax=Helicobacter sp. MIT 21-1697 TaxID=2993733 RepID=UPI00224A8B70|nr:ATP-binding cassette domain-containing protein [Helicobacter sp. MIT 21-1697]MCX2716436.1 ATP-binding cassette domain-containing protein [Helicobacter sp. MIT 21-1697]
MLRLCNVSYQYKSYRFFSTTQKAVLKHISLNLCAGESLAIMGASGCGKSTLAQIACGLLTPTRDELGQVGKVYVNEQLLNLNSLRARRLFYAQVQILFQDAIGSLNPRLNCFENLIEPLLYLRGIAYKDCLKYIEPLLERVGLHTEILDKNVAMISGGEAQRICLIRALLVNPKLLILDESTSGLDYELCLEVIAFLKAWQKQHKSAILLITHDKHIAQKLCENLKYIKNGALCDLA